jgi:hypothetical protein
VPRDCYGIERVNAYNADVASPTRVQVLDDARRASGIRGRHLTQRAGAPGLLVINARLRSSVRRPGTRWVTQVPIVARRCRRFPFERFSVSAGLSCYRCAFGSWPDCHGKEGVAGSSPAEGFRNRAVARFSCLRRGRVTTSSASGSGRWCKSPEGAVRTGLPFGGSGLRPSVVPVFSPGTEWAPLRRERVPSPLDRRGRRGGGVRHRLLSMRARGGAAHVWMGRCTR